MSIEVTFRCDRCNREQPTNEQFWHLALILWHHGNTPNSPAQAPTKKVDLCRECVETFGLVARLPERRDQRVEPPTVEDLVRQVIEMCMPEERP